MSGGNCHQVIEEESRAKTKPSGDWTTDVTILEEDGANSPAVSCPFTKECISALKILDISSGNDVHDEDGNTFRRRSNCLDSKMNLITGSRGDCGLQDSGDDSVGKDVMQSVSDVSLALSDISLQFDEKCDSATASEDPQGSDHTHLESCDGIRLQEVLVNELVTDERVQEVSSPSNKPLKRRRNGTIENTFKSCPSNESMCSAASTGCVSTSSVDSVGVETSVSVSGSVSGVRGMTSVSSVSSVSSISSGNTVRSSDPISYETAVATIDFFAESDEDSQSQRTTVKSRPGRISRCASDRKVNMAHAGKYMPPLSLSNADRGIGGKRLDWQLSKREREREREGGGGVLSNIASVSKKSNNKV